MVSRARDDQVGSPDGAAQGVERLGHNECDADRRGEVEADVAPRDQVIDQRCVSHRTLDHLRETALDEVIDVRPPTGAEVVEDDHLVPARHQGVAHVRADESCSSGDQIPRCRSPLCIAFPCKSAETPNLAAPAPCYWPRHPRRKCFYALGQCALTSDGPRARAIGRAVGESSLGALETASLRDGAAGYARAALRGGAVAALVQRDATGPCADDCTAAGHVAVLIEAIPADDRTAGAVPESPAVYRVAGRAHCRTVLEAPGARPRAGRAGCRRRRGGGGGNRQRDDQWPQDRGLPELGAGLAPRESRRSLRRRLEQAAAPEFGDRRIDPVTFHPELTRDLGRGTRAVAAPPNRCCLGRECVGHTVRRVVHHEPIVDRFGHQSVDSSLRPEVDVVAHSQDSQARPRARSSRRPRIRSPSTRKPLCSYSLVIHVLHARGSARPSPPRTSARRTCPWRRSRPRPEPSLRAQDVRVVQARPLALGEQVRRLAQRRERAVVLEHPRVDVLAGEQVLDLLELGRQHALGRPARRAAVRPAGLVQDRVDRVAGETRAAASTSCRNAGESGGSSSR